MFWLRGPVRGAVVAIGMVIAGIGFYIASATGHSYFGAIGIVGLGLLGWAYYLNFKAGTNRYRGKPKDRN